MTSYDARIFYPDTDNKDCTINREGFASVKEATAWLAQKLSWIMMHWAEINPNGVTVTAEVFNDEEGIWFSDLYELKCGL